MGVKLPEDAKEAISKWTEKSYKMGLGQEWDDDRWKVEDANALEFFRKHDQHFFGKQFENYSADMRQVVEDEIKGISAYTPEVKKRMRDKLGEAFEHPHVKDYYDLCIRNAVNKSRNYGRTFQYERLGIAEVEVVAVLDNKTSRICRAMNGRRISVPMLADYVRETLETPMDELTEKFAWPTNKDADAYSEMSTDQIMSKIKCKLSPYHGRCRTTTVISKNVKVKKAGGGFFSGDVEPQREKESRWKRERRGQIERLTQQERLSKISQQATNAWWDIPGESERLDNHIRDHKDEFSGDYEKISKNILKNYQKVFTFIENKQKKWGFYNEELDGLAIVAEKDGQLRTVYKPKGGLDAYLKKRTGYLEIK